MILFLGTAVELHMDFQGVMTVEKKLETKETLCKKVVVVIVLFKNSPLLVSTFVQFFLSFFCVSIHRILPFLSFVPLASSSIHVAEKSLFELSMMEHFDPENPFNQCGSKNRTHNVI